MYNGSCLCGALKFEVTCKLGAGEMCHCVQCRQWTGHLFASTEVNRKALTIKDKSKLKWFYSSKKVRRGFCYECGSSLFFDPIDKDKHNWIGISLGAFAAPTDVEIEQHIFTVEKGDYYQINDSAPQNKY